MKKKELVDERVKLHQENKRALEEAAKAKRTLNAEEQAQVDARFARIDEIKQHLEREEQIEAEERDVERAAEETRRREELDAQSRGRRAVGGDDPAAADQRDRNLAFRGWAMGRAATPEMREAAARVGVNLAQGFIDMAVETVYDGAGKPTQRFVPVRTNSAGDILEKRALSIGTTTAGGNSVPNEMMRAFYEFQKWVGTMRELSTVIQTETGATLPWPTVSDTANTGRILAEATAATTTTDPTFGVVNVGAYKFSSDAVIVSVELLQDSFIDLASYLGRALGTRLGRIQNTKYTVGAGTTEPKGIIVGATTVAAAVSTAFTLDEVITLVHAVDKAYRNLPGAGFMAHDTIIKVLRQFKDGQGRYMWEPAVQVGQPDRLYGYPIYTNNDMDSALTTGKKLLGFGHAGSAHLIRDAGAVRIIRSDEKYVLEHQVVFEASQRSSSETIDTTAFKVLTLA